MSAIAETQEREVFAGYLLVQELGKGGMGQVFRARKVGHGVQHEVALKRILDNSIESPEHLHYFLQEMQTVAGLKHENVVTMYDFGRDSESGRYYLVLELVEGYDVRTLTKRLAEAAKKTGPRFPGQDKRLLPMAVVAYIGLEVAKGLEFAHGQTSLGDGGTVVVIHRDISPDNIMINVRGVVMINDFGIAKPIGDDVDQHTRTGMLRGKARYASPEQCCGQPLDVTTDLYALAIALFELATGRHPYDDPEHPDERIEAKVYRATKKLRPPIAELAPDMPPAMQELLERIIQPDPTLRPQSAAELREPLKLAMQQALAGSQKKGRTYDFDDVKAWASRLVKSVYAKRTEVEMQGFRSEDDAEPTSAPKSHKRLISHVPTKPERPASAATDPSAGMTESERTALLDAPGTAPMNFATMPLADAGSVAASSSSGATPAPRSSRTGLLIALSIAVLVLFGLVAGIAGFALGGSDDDVVERAPVVGPSEEASIEPAEPAAPVQAHVDEEPSHASGEPQAPPANEAPDAPEETAESESESEPTAATEPGAPTEPSSPRGTQPRPRPRSLPDPQTSHRDRSGSPRRQAGASAFGL